MRCTGCVAAVVAAGLAGAARADLVVLGQFSSASAVGLGYDHVTGSVWMYPGFGAELVRYSAAGTLLGSVPRPGEAANDADVEVTVGPLTLGTTMLPGGTLLFINGEAGPADVYAVDGSTGAVLATMATQFGVSHVVGGAHHPLRGTLFLVQDAVPAGTANDNLVAEIDPATGAVVQQWQTTASAPTFTVDYGDIEVAANGNILIVSSDEAAVGEFTPTGAFVGLRPLPSGVSSLCGIGVDPVNCEWWVIRTNGQVSRLGGLGGDPACGCYANCDGSSTPPILNVSDFICFQTKYAAGDPYANCDGSTIPPVLNVTDFICFQTSYAAGCS